jgi:HemY protein
VKWLIGLMVLFLMAVFLAVFAKSNAGYLLFVYPPYRVELSLPFALGVSAIGFLVFYALVRFVTHTLRLPEQVRAYRLRRSRGRARNAMDQALVAYFEGHYRRAERFAGVALRLQESPVLSAVLAARCAHEQRNTDGRESYLKAIDAVSPENNLLKLVTQVEFALEERRTGEALSLLKSARQLAPRNPALVRLELKAHTLAKNWEQVIECVGQLSKSKDVEREQLEPLRLAALKENLKLKGRDKDALKEYWRKITSNDRLDLGIASAAAHAFAALSLGEEARAIIERTLDHHWDTELVELYSDISAEDTIKQIDRAETWLVQHPSDAVLLLSAGKLCARERLWGKAQSYIEASLAVEPSREAHAAYANLMQKMGKPELALTYNRRGPR